MPRVVADSDDESDTLIVETSKSRAGGQPIIANIPPPVAIERDPVFDADFDQFLSPTQRLSTYDDTNDNASQTIVDQEPTNSSHERFLDEIAPLERSHTNTNSATSTINSEMSGNSKKRSHTAIEGEVRKTDQSNAAKKKKTKNYGSTSKSDLAANFRDLIHDAGSFETMQHDPSGSARSAIGSNGFHVADNDDTSPLDLTLSLSANPNHVPLPSLPEDTLSYSNTTRTTPYLDTPSMQESNSFYGNTMLHGTTSRSSVGGHQSFNIDPRTLGADFDDINPFGRLSQVSLDKEVESDQSRGIEEIFRSASTRSAAKSNSHSEQPSELHKVGGRHSSLDLNTTQEGDQLAETSPIYSPISNRAETPAAIDAITLDRGRVATSGSTGAMKAPPSKRGKRPKAELRSEQLATTDDIDGPHIDDVYSARTLRASTVESVSNVSEASHITTDSKKGKRKSKKTDPAATEDTRKKMPSSELGLDSKEVIGLSPERYKPRPSKRRGHKDTESNTSTAKEVEHDQPSAKEHFDDEQSIVEDEPTKSEQLKGKKGKKSKVKQGKAPAAVMPEVDDAIHSDQDEERARRVESPDIKPDPNGPVSERESHISQDLEGGIVEMSKGEAEDSLAKVSVNIPNLSKPEEIEVMPEPKKRGRKRKNVVQECIKSVDEEGKEVSVLADKDTNAQVQQDVATKRQSRIIDDEEEDENPLISDVAKHDQENVLQEPDLSSAAVKQLDTTQSVVSTSKSASSSSLINSHRIGLSKRNRIPSLLRSINRGKEAPKHIERKEKLNKRQLEEKEQERIAREEAEAEGREYVPLDVLRDKDGRLVEWDF